ncbi:MAG: MBL fold metallo-hydrolase [Caulobacteraceae bacterium]
MIPFVREIDVEYGRCDEVSPLIRRVIAANSGPFTYKGTGTYIVGRGEVAVIDPGPAMSEHLEALKRALEGERISAILVTHHHLDHSPLARPLSEWSGAKVFGRAAPERANVEADGPRLEEGRDEFVPDVTIEEGETFEGPGWRLEALRTPGHTSNHVCFALTQENALFSGDHVMGWSTTVVTPPDGDMDAYMASLEKVAERGFTTLWPTHGPPVREAAPFLAAYAEHRRERERQILAALASGRSTIEAMVPRLYASVDKRLWPAAARSVLAHLISLTRAGRVACEGAPSLASVYRLG